jgi:hypothetical protein
MGEGAREIWPFIQFDLSFFSQTLSCSEQQIGNRRGESGRSTCHLLRSGFSVPERALLNLNSLTSFLRVTDHGDKRRCHPVTRKVTAPHHRKASR